MGLSDIVRDGVALADEITGGTGGLQDTVLIFPWIGINDYAGPSYAVVPVSEDAIVIEREFTRRMPNGQEITQKAEIIIPRPIAPNGANGRREPIDPRDEIILPSGYTGPILSVEGITDPITHAPYMYVVILG